jgi:hypothetical protein
MPATSDTFDPAIQTEDIGFGSDELISCNACRRQNAPNRIDCIYCGAPLEARSDAIDTIKLRKLESWESGTSIVVNGGTGDISKAAELLSLERDRLEEIVSAGVPLPVAWVDDNACAVLKRKLEELGLTCSAIADAELALAKPPVRLAGMQIGDDDLTLIDLNTRAEYRHSWAELVLIVTGVFATGSIDSTEKRRLRKTTVTNDTTISADEPVFDVYVADSAIGYRVQLAGFDYSCLGNRMAPLATENMSRLIDLLHSRAPESKLFNEYKSIRHLLTGIWDIESRKDPKGLQQTGVGKREFGVVHSTNNARQFTRFSRLQRLML